MSMQEMNKLLANIAVARQNAANMHWNMRNPYFWPMHKITEKLYEGLADIIDEVSEKIVMQGETPISTYKGYLEHADIKEIEPKHFTAEEIVHTAVSNLDAIHQAAHKVHEWANNHNKSDVIQPLLDEIFLFIDKQRWIFNAHLTK